MISGYHASSSLIKEDKLTWSGCKTSGTSLWRAIIYDVSTKRSRNCLNVELERAIVSRGTLEGRETEFEKVRCLESHKRSLGGLLRGTTRTTLTRELTIKQGRRAWEGSADAECRETHNQCLLHDPQLLTYIHYLQRHGTTSASA